MPYALTAAFIATLVACGGGGGGSSGASTTGLSGIIAVGAALPGATVTLKDANGTTRSTTADTNGAYSFSDVSGLTAPFIIKASGSVGGNDYTLYSVLASAPSAGVSGVLNVTPITNSVVAQAAGGDAANYFTTPTNINTTNITAAKDRLKTALDSVRADLGLPANFDYFSTQFSANGTGADKLLDAISFQGNSDGTVTVINKSTNVAVVVPTSGSPSALPALDAAAKTDTSGIKTLLTQFNTQAATLSGIQSLSMANLFDAGFLHDGRTKAAFLKELESVAGNVQMANMSLDGCETISSVLTCKAQVALKFTNYNSHTPSYTVSTGMRFVQSGSDWLFKGNTKPLEFSVQAVAQQTTAITIASTLGDGSTPSNPRDAQLLRTAGGPVRSTLLRLAADSEIPDANGNPTHPWQSIKLYRYINSAWTLVTSIADISSCNPYKANCSVLQAHDDTDANDFNTDRINGTLRMKVILYPSTNFGDTSPSSATEFEFRPRFNLFTDATAQGALGGATSATIQGMSTNNVTFTGTPKAIKFTVKTGSTTLGSYRFVSPQDNIAGLNGLVTSALGSAITSNRCAQNTCTAFTASDAHYLPSLTFFDVLSDGRMTINTYTSP